MKVIFYYDKNEHRWTFFCSLCYSIIKDNDFYKDVPSNCLIKCNNSCREILLCVNGYNSIPFNSEEFCDLDKLENSSELNTQLNNMVSKCTKKISKNYVEVFFNSLPLKENLIYSKNKFIRDNVDYYETGIVKIHTIRKSLEEIQDEIIYEHYISPVPLKYMHLINIITFVDKKIPDCYSFDEIYIHNENKLNDNKFYYIGKCSECSNEYNSYIFTS